ncbi:MAG: hypothetical protein HQ472_00655 [Ignavibacteria bacterium]|nr:hypothetical protein [Ignavibacteria bacterium]
MSKIFEWYASDFGANSDEIVQYISKYSPALVAESLAKYSSKWKIEYGEYDWKLNIN